MATTVDFVHAYTAVNNSGLVLYFFCNLDIVTYPVPFIIKHKYSYFIGDLYEKSSSYE